MPMLVLFLMVISLSYQFFFRFNHWVDPQRPNTVYERDNLTGQVHQFNPTTQVSMISRITGHYPQDTLVANAPTPPAQNNVITQPEAVTAMAIAQPIPGPNAALPAVATSASPATARTNPAPSTPAQKATSSAPVPVAKQSLQPTPPATAANVPAVGMVMINERQLKSSPQTTSSAAAPQRYMEQTADFNHDGHTEKITLARTNPAPGTPTEITILSGQREVFFGRGDRLQMLSSERNGWKDIALVLPNGRQQMYGYDLSSQGYEPLLAP